MQTCLPPNLIKRIVTILFCYTIQQVTIAQDRTPCGFESLFTFKPGMNKMIVLDSVNRTYNLTIVSRDLEKLPAYKSSGGDSIIRETINYNIDKSPCFTGRRSKLQLIFADDKLYKAYLSTVYPKNDHQQMVSNFNSLRRNIKRHWEFENEVKLTGKSIIGFGFDYSKTKKANMKTEKVTLQYVDLKAQDPHSPYLLEVIWANLANTRMEASSY